MCSATLVFLLAVFSLLPSISSSKMLENVALYKKCRMSSHHPHNQDSCKGAVNGNTAGQFPGKDNCVHTDQGDPRPWFEVDLGIVYPIKSIVVFARDAYERRMGNTTITVDGKSCYQFPKETSSLEREMHVQCSQPMNGQKVRITKLIDGKPSWDQTLNICELQVFSCADEAWGNECDQLCGECKGQQVCDKVTGHCPECAPGLLPPWCLKPASSNKDTAKSGTGTRVTGTAVALSVTLLAVVSL